MEKFPLVGDPLQLKIAVLCDGSANDGIQIRFSDKITDPALLKQNLYTKGGMIHCIRLKTVKSFQLFKPSDIMEQANELRQISILLCKSHPLANLSAAVNNTVRVNDLQTDFIVFSVVVVEVGFKLLSGIIQINVYHFLLLLCRFR